MKYFVLIKFESCFLDVFVTSLWQVFCESFSKKRKTKAVNLIDKMGDF